jgi:hypothetical protein
MREVSFCLRFPYKPNPPSSRMAIDDRDSRSALDQYVAPGLRLWMLIGLVSGVLLMMIVIVCCFMKIRIPRTKRQIELIAARRKLRKQQQNGAFNESGLPDVYEERRTQAIVMNSLATRPGRSDRIHSAGNGHRREPLNSHSVNV